MATPGATTADRRYQLHAVRKPSFCPLGILSMEYFWLILVTEGNEDETEINEFERRR